MIGGGVTGCSCALTLAERGVRVRLYEAREIAGGASGRNGGFALRGATPPYDEARRLLGAERARRADGADRAVARPAGGARRRRVPARREPAARGRRGRARGAAARARCVARGRVRRRMGRRSGIAARHGSTQARSIHPRDGALQPARWVRRLARARGRGRAPTCASANRSVVDELAADIVVVAVDGFTARLLPELRRRGSRRRAARCWSPSLCRTAGTSGRTTPAAASTTGSSCRTDGS